MSPAEFDTNTLVPLSMLELVADRFTERMRVLSFLKRIDTVHIEEYEDHDGVVYYKMNVIFEHHITRIPTNSESRHYEGKADRVALRCFSDFSALRKAMWHKVQEHGILRCRYCDDIFNYLLFSKTQPNIACKLAGKTKRMQILAAFINDIVVMARTCQTCQVCRVCAGVDAIPHLVSEFLQHIHQSADNCVPSNNNLSV